MNKNKRYEYLINARNYHFTQFNIWMAFFITINGGLCIVYANLLKDTTDADFEKILMPILGYTAAFLFHCSCKGFRYWSTNFTRLINHHEDNYAKYDYNRVYSCFANKEKNRDYLNPLEGADISTSRVVSLFSYILTYGWGILFLSNIYKYVKKSLLYPLLDVLLEPLGVREWIVTLELPLWLAPFALLILSILLLLSGIIITCSVNKIILQKIKEKRWLKSDLNDHTDLEIGKKITKNKF